jgi:hypothetical protein
MKKKVEPIERITVTEIDGQTVEAGQRLLIEGEEGAYSFRYLNPDGSLTCWGGVNQHESWRSFRAERCHMPGWVPTHDRDRSEDENTSRSSRYGAFELWALANQGETFTTQQLVDVSGFSSATMLKYLKTSLLFEPVKKGTWRVLLAEGTRNDVS